MDESRQKNLHRFIDYIIFVVSYATTTTTTNLIIMINKLDFHSYGHDDGLHDFVEYEQNSETSDQNIDTVM